MAGVFVPIVNGFVEAAGAVGNGWLNKPPGGLNMVEVVGPNGFGVVVVVVLLLPKTKIFDVVDGVEDGTK